MTYLASLELTTDVPDVALLLERNEHHIKTNKRSEKTFEHPEGLTIAEVRSALETAYALVRACLSNHHHIPASTIILRTVVKVWEKEINSWKGSILTPIPLAGFSNFRLHKIDFIDEGKPAFFEIQKTTWFTSSDRKDGGDPHRAIFVDQKLSTYISENNINHMMKLLDESMLRQAFDCFEAFT